jgi:hypothetical protein
VRPLHLAGDASEAARSLDGYGTHGDPRTGTERRNFDTQHGASFLPCRAVESLNVFRVPHHRNKITLIDASVNKIMKFNEESFIL